MTREPVPQVASVTFRHGPHSQRLESLCHAQAQKLFRLSPRIARCEVVIDSPGGTRPSDLPAVSLNLTLPGDELVIHESPGPEHGDAAAVVRRAFDAARRVVLERAAKRRDRGRQGSD